MLDSSTIDRQASFRSSLVLFIINVTGVAAYVRGTSHSWAIPKEQAAGVHTVTGEPFVWSVYTLPILGVFALVQLFWAIHILRKRKWASGLLWLLAVVIWMAAVWIDFAHHAG
jgi:hypothetical protein